MSPTFLFLYNDFNSGWNAIYIRIYIYILYLYTWNLFVLHLRGFSPSKKKQVEIPIKTAGSSKGSRYTYISSLMGKIWPFKNMQPNLNLYRFLEGKNLLSLSLLSKKVHKVQLLDKWYIVVLPFRELTYPLKSQFWRWFFFLCHLKQTFFQLLRGRAAFFSVQFIETTQHTLQLDIM